MIASYLGVGIVLGAVLGLSGSGGAIIGIPLLMWVMASDLKTATSMVLPIVGLIALIQWSMQRQSTQWRVVGWMVAPLLIAAWATGFARPLLPEFGLKMILVSFALWGLGSTWKTAKLISQPKGIQATKSAAIGALAGVVTTLTGLGGGLLLVPLLRKGLGLDMTQSVATSLIIIVMSTIVAMGSLFIHKELVLLDATAFFWIVIGAWAAAFSLRQVVTYSSRFQQFQKLVYSAVLTISILGILGF